VLTFALPELTEAGQADSLEKIDDEAEKEEKSGRIQEGKKKMKRE